MFKRLYITMALYFLCIIGATLAAVMLLFFFTVGRPLAREVHAMLRSHTQYLVCQVQDMESHHPDTQALIRSFDRFKASYGFDIALFDTERRLIASTSGMSPSSIALTDAMFRQVNQRKQFVQSSHFSRPLIYMVPVTFDSGAVRYLYITRRFAPNRTPLVFLGGLGLIGLLLTVAVYPLSRGITRPLTRLTRELEKITAGQFDDIPESVRKDEIGQLIRGYRAMSQSVHRMILSRKQLLADISHELCSPLARIRVGTELIKARIRDERTGRYLENIDHDIDTLDHLIDSLSAFSRMNLPGFTLARTRIQPRDLLDRIRDLYQPLADARRIDLAVRTIGDLPAVGGDGELLKQVFSNLMDNALRYTDSGETLNLGAEDTGRAICFYVDDPGPGVPETENERIFEPLYRVDFSRNRNLGGAGLGLAISRKIVELHGGDLRYTRIMGRTRFTFCLDKIDQP